MTCTANDLAKTVEAGFTVMIILMQRIADGANGHVTDEDLKRAQGIFRKALANASESEP